jgi:nucleoside triphosphate diphosphatase
MTPRDFSLMLLVCLTWAAHTIVSKIVVSGMEIPPLFYAATRYGIVAVLALPWLLPAPRPRWRIALVGFLMGGGGFALFFLGIKTSTPSSAAIVSQLGLPITTLLSVAMLGEKIYWRRGLGIALTFFGGLIVMWNPSNGFAISGGLALILGSALAGSLAAVMMKQIEGVRPLQFQAWIGIRRSHGPWHRDRALRGPDHHPEAQSRDAPRLSGLGSLPLGQVCRFVTLCQGHWCHQGTALMFSDLDQCRHEYGPRMKPSSEISRLLEIMAALRAPDTGCPWDIEQNFASIAPYTLEEAYEVVDAIERGDRADLKDELGDLLLQVVFHARMAEEEGAFAFPDVVKAITTKLIRRHPHVFGQARDLSPTEVKSLWDEIKRNEKAERRASRIGMGMPPEAHEIGFLGGIPTALPALTRAQKLTAKAAKVGFDWPEAAQVIDKIHEELGEVKEASSSGSRDRIEDEIGDLLFSVTNLARHFDIDPENALRRTNAKFERRFRAIEHALEREGKTLEQASLEEMEELWVEAKFAEREPGSGS